MAERLDTFAQNVKAQLRLRGWTAPELARRADLSAKTVNNVLKGRHAPQADVLEKIAKALGLELWQMFFPALPEHISPDDTWPHLVMDAARLSPEAAERVAHMIDLELKAARKP